MKAKMVYIVVALALVFSLTAVIMPANPAQALNIEVTNTNDSGVGSLRKAIADSAPGGTINFSDTVTGTITLTSGQLTVNKSLTITGPGEANLAISGGNTSRVFYINNSRVDMSGMTIRNGNISVTADHGGGIFNNGGNVTMTNCTVSGNAAGDDGGGLYNNAGNVTMTSCTVSGNTADGDDGGGLYNYAGNVTMTNCTISDNEAEYGGGLLNAYGGEVRMTGCTVSGNTAGNNGGGLYNEYRDDGTSVTMTDCTISDNKSETDDGGGLYNDGGNVTMTNCTVSGNTAGWWGGGINISSGTLNMTNCTVSGNTAEGTGNAGGGIFNDDELTMTCTIVYSNTPNDIYGGYTDAGENIVGDPDPLLGPLQNNGGPTETHALLAGSPAIDGCTGGNCTVGTDQRGVTRPQLIACDVGAYEYQQQSTVPVGGTVEPVDRIGIVAPWLGLAAMMAVAMTIAVVVRRRMA